MVQKLPPGLLYAVAAIPLTVAGVLVSDLLHLSHAAKVLTLCLSLVAELFLVGMGAAREVSAEKRRLQQGHERRMIAIYGMLICGIGFIVFLGIYLWPEQENQPLPQSDVHVKVELPPLGSLRLGDAIISLEHSQSTNETAARIEVPIFNDTDKLIYFKATTAGRINEIPFDLNKVHFDGYVAAHKDAILMSKRLVNIPLTPPNHIDEAYVTGIYEYELDYGYADNMILGRKSVRALRIIVWGKHPDMPPGAVTKLPLKVEIYNQSES